MRAELKILGRGGALRWMLTAGLLLMQGLGAQAMTQGEAAYLLRRTGFSPSPAEIEAIEPLSFEDAVDLILFDTHKVAQTAPPAWINSRYEEKRKKLVNIKDEEERRRQRKAYQNELHMMTADLKAWWYREMLDTSSPFTERMTLFWHNHFTSSGQKVKNPMLLYQQNVLLREGALGNLRDLTQAIAKDPAMLIYLDNTANRVQAPNENFARELMELFTLGEGHYSENDVKQAARAFTGWHVQPASRTYTFVPRLHDFGSKTFMGQTGMFDGESIIEIIFEQEQVAPMIVSKLWREFISPTPDPAEVARLSALFRGEKYEIKPLMRALLLTPAFRDPINRGTLVKSPVELSVGMVRTFGIPIEDTRQLVRYGRDLGQDVLDPPNVKGWTGGDAWINSDTLLGRRELIERALRGDDADEPLVRKRGEMAAPAAPAEMQVAQADEMMMTEADTPQAKPQAARRAPKRERPMRYGFGKNNPVAATHLTEWAMRLPGDLPSVEELESLLLALPPAEANPPARPVGAAVRSLVLDPVYQLK